MFRFIFIILIPAILGAATIAPVAPLDVNAEENPIDITANLINNYEFENPDDSIAPGASEFSTSDIESRIGSDEPLVFLVRNNVGTRAPHVNHNLNQAEIRECQRRFATLVLSGIIFLIIAWIASFITRS